LEMPPDEDWSLLGCDTVSLGDGCWHYKGSSSPRGLEPSAQLLWKPHICQTLGLPTLDRCEWSTLHFRCFTPPQGGGTSGTQRVARWVVSQRQSGHFKEDTFLAEVRDCTPDCPAGMCVFVMQNGVNVLKEPEQFSLCDVPSRCAQTNNKTGERFSQAQQYIMYLS
jgi:hypothetical protein